MVQLKRQHCTLCGVAVEDHGSSCGMVPAHTLVKPARTMLYSKIVGLTDCPDCKGTGYFTSGKRPGEGHISLIGHCHCATLKPLG